MGSRLRAEAYLSQYGKSHHSSVSSAAGAIAGGGVGGLYGTAGGRGTFPKLSGNRVTLDITQSSPVPLQQPLLIANTSTIIEEEKFGAQKLNIPLDLNGNKKSVPISQPHSSSDLSSGFSQNELDVLQKSLDAQLTPKVESRLHFGDGIQEETDKNVDETNETETTDYVLRGDKLESIQLSTAHPLVNVHTKLIYTSSNISTSIELPSHYEIIVPEGSSSSASGLDIRQTDPEVILSSSSASIKTTSAVLPTNILTTLSVSTVMTTVPFPSSSSLQ